LTTPTFDTLKTAHKLQSAGMPRKQAEAVAETLADVVADRSCKAAVIEAVQKTAVGTNLRMDAMERRLGERIDTVERRIGGVEQRLGERIDAVEKGQAVLMENQLQTNRALTAIMTHLGIPKPAE